ncbi:hypothetical protein ACLOAV_010552 [Pseudogymnoascus australis]
MTKGLPSQSGPIGEVTEPPKLDLETYIQNYTGTTKFERLLFIGLHSTVLRAEALKSAVAEAKKGRNVAHYNAAQDAYSRVAPDEPEAQHDDQWVASMEKQNKVEGARLEAELKGYKNNLIKESIRIGNEDCGRFYQSTGNLQKAYEAYQRMRQDAIINKHIIELNKHLTTITIEQKNWLGAVNHAQKLLSVTEQTQTEEAKAVQPFIKIAQGLAFMAQKKYSDAATSFLGVGTGMDAPAIMSGNDVAIYGGLCALASIDRDQLQKRVLNSTTFRSYLELEPEVRRAITSFVNGRYSVCLSILEGYRNDYLLDIHLSSHVSDIFRLIRSKSIAQYFIPFSCVTLESLNASFAQSGESIEEELLGMIKNGTLNARLDTIKGTLNAVIPSPRAQLQQKTLDSVKEYERELRQRILRMNVINAGLELEPKNGASVGGDQSTDFDQIDFETIGSPPYGSSFKDLEGDETLG